MFNIPQIDIASIEKSNVPKYKHKNLYGDIVIEFPDNIDDENFFVVPIKLDDFVGTINDFFDLYGNKLKFKDITENDIKKQMNNSNIDQYLIDKYSSLLGDLCNCVLTTTLGATCEYENELLKQGKVRVKNLKCVSDGVYEIGLLKEKCCSTCKGKVKRYIKREEDYYTLRYVLIAEDPVAKIECNRRILKEFSKIEKCVEYYEWKVLASTTFNVEISKYVENNVIGTIFIEKTNDGQLESYDYKVFFNNAIVCSGSFDKFENNSNVEINFSINSYSSVFVKSKTVEKEMFVLDTNNSESDCDVSFEVKDFDSNTSKKYCLGTSNKQEVIDCNANVSLQEENHIVIVYKRNDCKKTKIILQ